MKIPAMLWIACGLPVAAQVDFPGNPLVGPKKYTTRKVGGEVDPGAEAGKSGDGDMVRYTSYIVLHDSRLWMSVEGKPLSAKLVAFEDLVVEAKKGEAEPAMPQPPERPTVVKDGKVRLLVGRKPHVVPLERLVPADRELVEGIQAAIDRKVSTGNQ